MLSEKRFNVLMVDDDQDDIFAINRGFRSAKSNIEFVPLSEAKKLFEYLTQKSPALPDLILLDVNMPRMNGFEVLAHLKSVPEWADIPVMVFSTSSHEADRLKAKQLGAVDFSTKVSSVKALETWIARIEKFLQQQP